MGESPKQTPLLEGLPATVPFVGPETQERLNAEPFKARLGANENVFGPSPKAVAAMQKAATELWMYADPEAHDLRHALADHHQVGADNIVVAAGIDTLLGCVARLYVEPGVKVVTSLGAYPTFNFHVNGFGGELVFVPYREDHEDPEGLLEAARMQAAKLLYISNPDNPMGTWWDGATLQSMIDRLPDGCLLLLDEAYIDTAPAGTAPAIDVDHPQVLRFRTFSKIHGMAGARVGYCIGHQGLISGFEKVRNHFGMNRAAEAGALASLGDREHIREVTEKIAASKAKITDIAARFGLKTLPSATNFIAIDCGRDGAYAKKILDGLIARGVFVRMPAVEPMSRCIRLSAGRDEDLKIFEEALADVMAELA